MDIQRGKVMRLVVLAGLVLLLAACGGSGDYAPKPRGYFRIDLPKKEYRAYDGGCPFTFDYPTYAVIELDKKAKGKPCWLDMQFPGFNGTLHLSYEQITSKAMFNELTEDSHILAFKHTVKASAIDEAEIYQPANKLYGVYYTIAGNAASSAQFYLTDSTRNYIRGALYFNTEPRLDSIQPVLNFVKKDMDVMIKSFRWK